MSAHFHKLFCGPRSLMIIAARLGKPINPDALWKRFSANIKPETGAVSVSTILDMARAFKIAQHLDVTHDVDRVGTALATDDVAGVLMTWERIPVQPGSAEFTAFHHVVAVNRVMLDASGNQYIEAESPHTDETSEICAIPKIILPQMMSSFLILYGKVTPPSASAI